MKVEVAVLSSPSLISLMVSVDVKQHLKENKNYFKKIYIMYTELRSS